MRDGKAEASWTGLRGRFGGPGALLAVTLALFGSIVFSGRLLYFGDFHAVFDPLRRVLGREAPWALWNPSLDNGQPLLANPFATALYPPALAGAWLGGEGARVLTLLSVLHLFWGALGTWRLLRHWGHRAEAAWLGAVVFAFNGASVSATYMVVLSATAAWVPWVVLASERAAAAGRAARRETVCLTAALVMLYLAGDPFLWVSGMLGVVLLVTRSRVGPLGIRSAALAGAAAFLLVSPHLYAAIRVTRASVRSLGFPLAEAGSLSIHPVELLGLAVPGLLGNLSRLGSGAFWAYALQGGRAPLFAGTYVGLLALALATLGAVSGGPRARRSLLWLLVLVLLGLGSRTPLFGLLHDHLPGFRALRFPGKWLLAAGLPIALLAAEGVSALFPSSPDGGRDRRRLFDLVAVGWLLLPAGVSLACGTARGATLVEALVRSGSGGAPAERIATVRGLLLAGAAWAAAPLLAALAGLRLGRGAPVVAALATLDLALAARGLAPTALPSFYSTSPHAVLAIRGDGLPRGRVYVEDTPEVKTFVPRAAADHAEAYRLRRERLDGYAAVSYGLDLAFGVDVEALSDRSYAALRSVATSGPERARVQALSMAGVTHVVTFREWSDPALRLIATVDASAERPLRVYRNAEALPRVRMAPRWGCVAGPAGFAASLRLAGSNPEVVRLDGSDPAALPLCGTSPRSAGPWPGRLELLLDRSGSLAVATDGPRGLLVVSDTLVPGLVASVDGARVPILRANVAFRAVPVPEGRHRVEIRYGPWS